MEVSTDEPYLETARGNLTGASPNGAKKNDFRQLDFA